MSARAIEAAKAFIKIYADDTALRKTLTGLRGHLSKVSEAFSGIGTTATIGGLAAAGAGMVSVAANAERSAVAFEVMLGSAGAARDMLEKINKMGAESPFGSAEFTAGAQVLLNFGVAAESVLPTLSMIGDIAAGDADKLARLTMVFGQTSAAGRLMGGDVLQMINAGFNPLQQISQKTGETMIELKKRMEAGGISSGEVAEAFKAATSAGGRFHGMTARISKTTIGVWMTLKDEIMMLAKDMGGQLLPVVNVVIRSVRFLVGLFGTWGKSLVQIGVAVGAFLLAMKALTLAHLAFAKASAIAQAFAGPKGWATLALGAAAAAGAVWAVNAASEGVAAEAHAAHAPLDTMAGDMQKIGNTGADAALSLKEVTNAAEDAQKTIDGMRSPVAQAQAAVEEFMDALGVGGEWGAITDMHPLVNAFREQESGYTESLRKIQDEIKVLSGVATEAGLELQHMMDVGVDPAKVEELRQLIQKRDELEKGKEDAKYWKQRQEDMQEAADEVKKSIATVQQQFALERQRLGTLVSAGLLTQAEADAALKKNPEFAAIMKGIDPRGVKDSMRSGSGAQDLRSVSGAAQITSVLNGQGTVQQQTLATIKQMKLGQDRLIILTERGMEGHQV